MADERSSTNEQLTRTGRLGSSRKLLQRKALQKGTAMPLAAPLEDSFPQQASQQQEAESGSSSAPAAAKAHAPAAVPTWSSEDEATLQGLLARRRAAGYQRRGRDVTGQRLRPGSITPNPDTVAATIVGIVAERGEVGRAELLDLMRAAAFPHPKARPSDNGWCQGYVAGVIRSGFLAVVAERSAAGSEASATASEASATGGEASATQGER